MADLKTSLIVQAVDRLSAPVRKMTTGVGRLAQSNKRLESTAEKVTRAYKNQSRLIERVTQQTIRLDKASERMNRRLAAAGGATLAGNELRRIGQALTQPAGQSLGAASIFEDFEVEFKVLLGSADRAQARLRELSRFAATTPFELPQIAMASRTLETLTQGAISTGAGLRMVGDVSAGTGQPIEELSIWFGRLYDGIQSGRPVGEALMRLQEIGALSGKTRSKIEELTESGADGSKIWNLVTESFGRYAGMMEERNKTLSGQQSNLSDAWTNLRAAVGKPLIPIVKPMISALSRATEIVQGFTERFPWLSSMIVASASALGVFVIGVGSAVSVLGSLMGAVGMAAFGMEWLGIKTSAATLRIRLLNRASLLSVGGLRKMGVAAMATGKMGLVRIGGWLPKIGMLVSTAIPALIGSLGAVSAAIMAIPGIGWIAAGITAVAFLIWKYWGPIKSFLGGFWEGFQESLEPVRESALEIWTAIKTGIGVALIPLRTVGRLLGRFFMPVDEGSDGMRTFGRIAGMVLGAFAKNMLWPLRILGWLATQFTKLANLIEAGFQKAGPWIDWLADKLELLIRPLSLLSDGVKTISRTLGLTDDEGGAKSGRRSRGRRLGRAAVATTALAASPLVAQPAAIQVLPAQAQPIRKVTPIAASQEAPVYVTINAPITIHAAPGMNPDEIAKQVKKQISEAEEDGRRKSRNRRRGQLHE